MLNFSRGRFHKAEMNPIPAFTKSVDKNGSNFRFHERLISPRRGSVLKNDRRETNYRTLAAPIALKPCIFTGRFCVKSRNCRENLHPTLEFELSTLRASGISWGMFCLNAVWALSCYFTPDFSSHWGDTSAARTLFVILPCVRINIQ